MSSTVVATPRQLVIFVVDKVTGIEEDHRLLLSSELESITGLPFMTERRNRSVPQRATRSPPSRTYVCWVTASVRAQYLHKTFALELIESVLTNYHEPFRKARVSSSSFHTGSLHHCHVHSIQSSYSYHNTISPRCF